MPVVAVVPKERVPALTVVAPVYVLAPVSVVVPAPDLVKPPAPLMTPDKVPLDEAFTETPVPDSMAPVPLTAVPEREMLPFIFMARLTPIAALPCAAKLTVPVFPAPETPVKPPRSIASPADAPESKMRLALVLLLLVSTKGAAVV